MPREIIKLKRPRVTMDVATDPDAWRIVGRRLLVGAKLIWSWHALPALQPRKSAETAERLAFKD